MGKRGTGGKMVKVPPLTERQFKIITSTLNTSSQECARKLNAAKEDAESQFYTKYLEELNELFALLDAVDPDTHDTSQDAKEEPEEDENDD